LPKTIDEAVVLCHQRNQPAHVMAVDAVYKRQSDIYGSIRHGVP
jgi:hypothetical protein